MTTSHSDKFKNPILRGDQFYEAFNQYFSNENENLGQFSEKVNILENSELSYRVINSWESLGLINSNRPEGKGWRKYSLLDIVWVNIIIALRKFNLSTEQLISVKSNLSKLSDKVSSDFPFLELYLTRAFSNIPVSLIVTSNGDAHLLTQDEYTMNREILKSIPDHIVINVNEILQRIFPDKNLKPIYNGYNLNEQEEEVIEQIRTGDWKLIEIIGTDGNIDRIDKTVSYDPVERILELLLQHEYQDIVISVAGGKIVKLMNKIKKKMG